MEEIKIFVPKEQHRLIPLTNYVNYFVISTIEESTHYSSGDLLKEFWNSFRFILIT